MSKSSVYAHIKRPLDDIEVSVSICGRAKLSEVTLERLRQIAKHAALELGKETKEIRGATVENSTGN